MSRFSRWLTGGDDAGGAETRAADAAPEAGGPGVSRTTSAERLAAFATREPAPSVGAMGGAERAGANGGAATVFVGDLRVEGRAPFAEGLVVRGTLELAEGALLEGPLEVEGDLVLGRNARIPYPVSVRGNLVMGQGSAVSAARVQGDAFVAQSAAVDGELSCNRLVLPPPDPAAARAKEAPA